MHGATAGLGNHAGQSRADNVAGLKLQSRRQHANHRDKELRARQVNRIGGNIAGLQPFQNMPEA